MSPGKLTRSLVPLSHARDCSTSSFLCPAPEDKCPRAGTCPGHCPCLGCPAGAGAAPGHSCCCRVSPGVVAVACGGARAGVHVGKVWWWRLLLPQAVPGALLFGAGRHGPVGARLCLLWSEPCSPRPRWLMAVLGDGSLMAVRAWFLCPGVAF